jgi:hypothetical protein
MTSLAYVLTPVGSIRPPWMDVLPGDVLMPPVEPWSATEEQPCNPHPDWPVEYNGSIVVLDGPVDNPWLRCTAGGCIVSLHHVCDSSFGGKPVSVWEAYVDGDPAPFKEWASRQTWAGSVEDFRALHEKETALTHDWPETARQVSVADEAKAKVDPTKPAVRTGKPTPRLRLGIASSDTEKKPAAFRDAMTAVAEASEEPKEPKEQPGSPAEEDLDQAQDPPRKNALKEIVP